VAAPIPTEPIREAAKEGARDGAKQGAQESAKEQLEEKLKQEGNPQGMAFAQGRPLVPNVSYTSEAAVGRADAPYGLKVVIQTQAPVPRVLLKMTFTAPIRSASFSYMMQVALGISSEVSENKTIFWKDNVLDFGFTSPVFSPDRPIVLFVYSAAPIAAKSLELIPR
jgi:hypothetical protein